MILALLALAGCQPQPAPESAAQPAAGESAGWPVFDYGQAKAAGFRTFELVADQSRIDIVVRRDGPLQRFGHDHALTVTDPVGFFMLDAARTDGSRADLRFPADRLQVDEPQVRTRYGLDTEPDAEAIEATRSNLARKILETTEWPDIYVELTEIRVRDGETAALARFTVRGVTSEKEVSFELTEIGEEVVIDGSLVLLQSALGIEPFSALGGGLRVADPLEIHYHLTGASLP
jgi:hypothetical protein